MGQPISEFRDRDSHLGFIKISSTTNPVSPNAPRLVFELFVLGVAR